MSASLRPGRDSGWLKRLTDRVLSSVAASNAKITTYSSSWLHDLDQVPPIFTIPAVLPSCLLDVKNR